MGISLTAQLDALLHVQTHLLDEALGDGGGIAVTGAGASCLLQDILAALENR